MVNIKEDKNVNILLGHLQKKNCLQIKKKCFHEYKTVDIAFRIHRPLFKKKKSLFTRDFLFVLFFCLSYFKDLCTYMYVYALRIALLHFEFSYFLMYVL